MKRIKAAAACALGMALVCSCAVAGAQTGGPGPGVTERTGIPPMEVQPVNGGANDSQAHAVVLALPDAAKDWTVHFLF